MARYFNTSNSNFVDKASAVVTGFPVSFAAWINAVNFAAFSNLITVSNASNSAIDSYTMQCNTASKVLVEANQAPSTSFDTVCGGTITTATWTHVCATWTDATHRSIYLNAVVTNSAANSATPGTVAYSVIGKHPSASIPCREWICLPAIWAAVLTQTEVSSLFAGAHPRRIRPDAIKACLVFSGDVTAAVDLVSTAWTITGTAIDEVNPPVFMM